MPTCTFVVLCEKAIQDEATRCWSMINMVENLGAVVLPTEAAYEIFSHWQFAPDEVGKPFEYQIVVKGSDAGRESAVHKFSADTPGVQIRTIGLPLPEKPGTYSLISRARVEGREWVESNPWVINISLVEPPAPFVRKS